MTVLAPGPLLASGYHDSGLVDLVAGWLARAALSRLVWHLPSSLLVALLAFVSLVLLGWRRRPRRR